MTRRFVFVGERRSPMAIRKGVTWADRQLAAKTLCHVLDALALPPEHYLFINAYGDDGSADPHALKRIQALHAEGWIIIGLGRTVQQMLARTGIPHRAMIHPAARGRIRRRALYRAHVAAVLFKREAVDATRTHVLEGLLGDCVFGIEALLTCPDLMLDELEQATRDAIEVARETLQAVETALQEGQQPPVANAVVSPRKLPAMQWFIIETERKTWTKYLVEAADAVDAKEKAHTGEYLGYRDGADESCRVYGPFTSRDAALESDAGYVDGR